jgi:hypothetical protein
VIQGASLKSRWRAAAVLGAVLIAHAPARAFEVQCGPEGGDAFGWSIAAGKDYDGDTVGDIAIGAPCASVGTDLHAGRVRIFSGKDGRLLRALAGTATDQLLGAALDWIDDIDGDGRADLVVGSATASVPKTGGGTILGAGKVDVMSSSGGVLWTAAGTNQYASFGESVATIPDVNGDGLEEVAVGASGAQVSGEIRGSAFLLSGASGGQLARSNGAEEGDLWGSLVGYAGDNDGDGNPDWFSSTRVSPLAEAPDGDVDAAVDDTTTTTTTSTTTTTIAPRAGWLRVLSGDAPYNQTIRDYVGQTLYDRLGRAAAVAGDWDGDGRDNLWIGSPGAEPLNLEDAGLVTLFTADETPFVELTEPTPQRFAAFGTSLVVPGSIGGDDTLDVVAGAPLAKVLGNNQTGRVHAFDGQNGRCCGRTTASFRSSVSARRWRRESTTTATGPKTSSSARPATLRAASAAPARYVSFRARRTAPSWPSSTAGAAARHACSFPAPIFPASPSCAASIRSGIAARH